MASSSTCVRNGCCDITMDANRESDVEHQRLQHIDTLIELGRYREAAREAGRLIADEPHNADAHCRLALAHLNLEEYEESLAAASQAQAAAPDYEWGHRLASIALGRLNRLIESCNAAEECVRCAPEFPHSLHTLASALMQNGLFVRAYHIAEKITQIEPEWSHGWELRAVIAISTHYTAEARRYAQRALELDPNSTTAHNILGSAAMRGGENELALGHFLDAARTNPLYKHTQENILLVAGSHESENRSLRIGLLAGLGALTIIWCTLSSYPPVLTVCVGVLYGVLSGLAIRARMLRLLPLGTRTLVDSRPELYHRYTRWMTTIALYGLLGESLAALVVRGYLTRRAGLAGLIWIIVLLGAAMLLIRAKAGPLPMDARLAKTVAWLLPPTR